MYRLQTQKVWEPNALSELAEGRPDEFFDTGPEEVFSSPLTNYYLLSCILPLTFTLLFSMTLNLTLS